MTPREREDREAIAAEYVLGLLSAAESEAFERRMDADPELAGTARAWSERLMGLCDVPEAVPRTAALWERIERDLTPRQAAVQAGGRRPAVRLEDRLWSSLAFWRIGAAAGAFAALVMAVVTALLPPPAPAPTVVTVLRAEDGAPGWVVQAYADATLQVTPLQPVAVPAGRALELWTLRDPREGPVSLGLLPPDGVTGLPIGDLPPPGVNQLFEITLEGAAGSPTGRPTGPVLGVGRTTSAG